MQNANCLDLVLVHSLVCQLVCSYVHQQIRLIHLRVTRQFGASSSHPFTHHTDCSTDHQTDYHTHSHLRTDVRSPRATQPAAGSIDEQARRLAIQLVVRSLLGAYLCWFGQQQFWPRTVARSRSFDRRSIGRLLSSGIGLYPNPLSPPPHFKSSNHKSSIRSSISSSNFILIASFDYTAFDSVIFDSVTFANSPPLSDHKPSALSSFYQPATFSEPNRFNFLLNFTAAFVHMLDVALKLFILTGASTFMGKSFLLVQKPVYSLSELICFLCS